MRDGYLRGALSPHATQRQVDVLAAYVAAGGSVSDAAELVNIRPSTVKRHLADLRARSGLTTEQLIYNGRAAGWLVVPSLEPRSSTPPAGGAARHPPNPIPRSKPAAVSEGPQGWAGDRAPRMRGERARGRTTSLCPGASGARSGGWTTAGISRPLLERTPPRQEPSAPSRATTPGRSALPPPQRREPQRRLRDREPGAGRIAARSS